LLVVEWTHRKNSRSTIKNKLGILRFFNDYAQLAIPLPSNQDLKLPESRKQSFSIVSPKKLLHAVYNPIVKNIIKFQVYFGLTKTEAIRITPIIVGENNDLVLWLDRKVACNNKDRCVPILTPEQNKVLEERYALLGEYQTLMQLLPEASINGLYKAELQLAGVPHRDQLRFHYARYRFKVLLHRMSSRRAINTIQQEMGYSNDKLLVELLKRQPSKNHTNQDHDANMSEQLNFEIGVYS